MTPRDGGAGGRSAVRTASLDGGGCGRRTSIRESDGRTFPVVMPALALAAAAPDAELSAAQPCDTSWGRARFSSIPLLADRVEMRNLPNFPNFPLVAAGARGGVSVGGFPVVVVVLGCGAVVVMIGRGAVAPEAGIDRPQPPKHKDNKRCKRKAACDESDAQSTHSSTVPRPRRAGVTSHTLPPARPPARTTPTTPSRRQSPGSPAAADAAADGNGASTGGAASCRGRPNEPIEPRLGPLARKALTEPADRSADELRLLVLLAAYHDAGASPPCARWHTG